MPKEHTILTQQAFLGCLTRDIVSGRVALVGCPLDLTSTYRRGSDKAPQAIRVASDSIETYSPYFDLDLADFPFSDIGDVDLQGRTLETALTKIRGALAEVLEAKARPLCLGGEHTITLAAVEALSASNSDFVVVHADAHSDLREEYEGNPVNHATVIRRVSELFGVERLIQTGIRAGTREEFAWMREHGTLLQWGPGAEKTLLARIAGRPVYLTLDLDVLDPACFHATGNPEPGGWFYPDLERLFDALTEVTVLAADIVELNPTLDPSEVGTITAAKIVREVLLMLGRSG